MLYQLSYFRIVLVLQIFALLLSGKRWIRTTEGKNQQIYSLPHLATLVSSQKIGNKFRADGGIRTPDQLITNQLLWPTELHRQMCYPTEVQRYTKNFNLQNFSTNFFIFSQRTYFALPKNTLLMGLIAKSSAKIE